jgi:hypothetical protein
VARLVHTQQALLSELVWSAPGEAKQCRECIGRESTLRGQWTVRDQGGNREWRGWMEREYESE